MAKEVRTAPGITYCVTATQACTVELTMQNGTVITLASTDGAGQATFAGTGDVVVVSDDSAKVIPFLKASPAAVGGGSGNVQVGITEMRAVDSLPSSGEEKVLYLVPSDNPDTQNVRDEFIWVKGEGDVFGWEQIGSTAVDLSGYATTTALTTHEASTEAHKTSTDRAILNDLEHDTTRGLSVVHKDANGNVDGRVRVMVTAGGDTTLVTSGALTQQAKILPSMTATAYNAYTNPNTGTSYLFSGHTMSATELSPYGITEACVFIGEPTLPLRLRGTELTFNGASVSDRLLTDAQQRALAAVSTSTWGWFVEEDMITLSSGGKTLVKACSANGSNTTKGDGLELGADGEDVIITGASFTFNGVNVATTNDIPNVSSFVRETVVKALDNIVIDMLNASCPVGTVKPMLRDSAPDGWLLCDGSTIMQVDYPDLVEVLSGLPYNSETDTGFGGVPTPGGSAAACKLPDLRNRTLWGADGGLGSVIEAGVPDIQGTFTAFGGDTSLVSEAFQIESANNDVPFAGSTWKTSHLSFSAARSNSIYGNSDTVQPPAIAVNWFIRALPFAKYDVHLPE